MNKQRKAIVAANWKMNVLPRMARPLTEQIKLLTKEYKTQVVIAPPFTHLPFLSEMAEPHFCIGAQNVHSALYGAYTGDISIGMLQNLGVEFILIGHSERRAVYIKENSLIPNKISLCLEYGIKVIYCCGEPIEEREMGNQNSFVEAQLFEDLGHLEKWNAEQIIIAYEPIWAIGTGLTASAEQADVMHNFIRNWIKEKYSVQDSNSTRIIYGGSVKASNAGELALKHNIDGALVGGASLDPEEFATIVKAWS